MRKKRTNAVAIGGEETVCVVRTVRGQAGREVHEIPGGKKRRMWAKQGK